MGDAALESIGLGAAADQPTWDWPLLRRRCLVEAHLVLRQFDDAEEAVQEALARAWRRRGACRTPHAPLPWLLQITRNEALRVLDRRRRLDAREQTDAALEAFGSDDRRVEELVARVAIGQALEGLRPEERRLVMLRYVEDLSQPAVARRVGLPEGTVKVQLHRIRKRLRNSLEEKA